MDWNASAPERSNTVGVSRANVDAPDMLNRKRPISGVMTRAALGESPTFVGLWASREDRTKGR